MLSFMILYYYKLFCFIYTSVYELNVLIVNKTTKTIIDNAHETQKKIDNPNYVPKKKLPITPGFKKGRNPLPKSVTPTCTYKNIWLWTQKWLAWVEILNAEMFAELNVKPIRMSESRETI